MAPTKTKKKSAPRPSAKASKRPAKTSYDLAIGTTLTRSFKGQEIAVKVTKDGFQYEDETFKSISAVARLITGYMISGPVFFKLAGQKLDPQPEATDG